MLKNLWLITQGLCFFSGRGSEPFAETVVQLISRTGGISALAHPWSLKNPDAIIRSLKGAGLNGMEVYRSDGKVDGVSLTLNAC